MTVRSTLGVVVVTLLVLGMSGAGVDPAESESFFQEGEVRQNAAANNFGKTVIHYILNYAILAAGVVMMLGGAARMKERPGQGWTGVGSGAGVTYIGELVRGSHDPAAAASLLHPPAPGIAWELWVGSLLLQAALLAIVYGAVRRRAHVETQSQRL